MENGGGMEQNACKESITSSTSMKLSANVIHSTLIHFHISIKGFKFNARC